MRLIDLDGNTWDGTKLNSKYKPVYDSRGRNEMMGVTLGWLYDAPEFDLEKNNVEIRNKAIDDFVKECEAEYDNDGCPSVSDYLDYKLSLREIFEIAEQLKAGGSDG